MTSSESLSEKSLSSVSISTASDVEEFSNRVSPFQMDQAHILLVSLLDNFCSMYDTQQEKNSLLFMTLCKQLTKMGILHDQDFLDESLHMRNVYKTAFRKLVMQAVNSIEKEKAPVKLIQDVQADIPEETRYQHDFFEICPLGRGSFGSVFKVRNKLDGNEYAIKKISLQKKVEPKVFREVTLLARLDHINVVRYHSAWIEFPPFSQLASSEDTEQETDGTNVFSSKDFFTEDSRDNDIVPARLAVTLYIQMQLCQMTLRQWINARNDALYNEDIKTHPSIYLSKGKKIINYFENIKIFKQILKGVAYIHSYQLIHRDLKPDNILFYNDVVKIGDFGLVTNIPEARKSSLTDDPDLTGGVGTVTYSSPEQTEGKEYNEKADVFSLGMIFFEMFYPFNSGMERAQVLTELRKESKLPIHFLKEFPKESAFILWCIAYDPVLRPSCKEILDLHILDDSEEMFSRLNLQICQKDEEIRQLKKKIAEMEMQKTQSKE